MNSFAMPFLFIFSNVELARLWAAYRNIADVIRENQDRTNIAILDNEVRAGAHFRAKLIMEECRLRQKAGRGTFIFHEENNTFEVID